MNGSEAGPKNEACLDQPGSLYDYYYMCGLEMLTHLNEGLRTFV